MRIKRALGKTITLFVAILLALDSSSYAGGLQTSALRQLSTANEAGSTTGAKRDIANDLSGQQLPKASSSGYLTGAQRSELDRINARLKAENENVSEQELMDLRSGLNSIVNTLISNIDSDISIPASIRSTITPGLRQDLVFTIADMAMIIPWQGVMNFCTQLLNTSFPAKVATIKDLSRCLQAVSNYLNTRAHKTARTTRGRKDKIDLHNRRVPLLKILLLMQPRDTHILSDLLHAESNTGDVADLTDAVHRARRILNAPPQIQDSMRGLYTNIECVYQRVIADVNNELYRILSVRNPDLALVKTLLNSARSSYEDCRYAQEIIDRIYARNTASTASIPLARSYIARAGLKMAQIYLKLEKAGIDKATMGIDNYGRRIIEHTTSAFDFGLKAVKVNLTPHAMDVFETILRPIRDILLKADEIPTLASDLNMLRQLAGLLGESHTLEHSLSIRDDIKAIAGAAARLRKRMKRFNDGIAQSIAGSIDGLGPEDVLDQVNRVNTIAGLVINSGVVDSTTALAIVQDLGYDIIDWAFIYLYYGILGERPGDITPGAITEIRPYLYDFFLGGQEFRSLILSESLEDTLDDAMFREELDRILLDRLRQRRYSYFGITMTAAAENRILTTLQAEVEAEAEATPMPVQGVVVTDKKTPPLPENGIRQRAQSYTAVRTDIKALLSLLTTWLSPKETARLNRRIREIDALLARFNAIAYDGSGKLQKRIPYESRREAAALVSTYNLEGKLMSLRDRLTARLEKVHKNVRTVSTNIDNYITALSRYVDDYGLVCVKDTIAVLEAQKIELYTTDANGRSVERSQAECAAIAKSARNLYNDYYAMLTPFNRRFSDVSELIAENRTLLTDLSAALSAEYALKQKEDIDQLEKGMRSVDPTRDLADTLRQLAAQLTVMRRRLSKVRHLAQARAALRQRHIQHTELLKGTHSMAGPGDPVKIAAGQRLRNIGVQIIRLNTVVTSDKDCDSCPELIAEVEEAVEPLFAQAMASIDILIEQKYALIREQLPYLHRLIGQMADWIDGLRLFTDQSLKRRFDGAVKNFDEIFRFLESGGPLDSIQPSQRPQEIKRFMESDTVAKAIDNLSRVISAIYTKEMDNLRSEIEHKCLQLARNREEGGYAFTVSFIEGDRGTFVDFQTRIQDKRSPGQPFVPADRFWDSNIYPTFSTLSSGWRMRINRWNDFYDLKLGPIEQAMSAIDDALLFYAALAIEDKGIPVIDAPTVLTHVYWQRAAEAGLSIELQEIQSILKDLHGEAGWPAGAPAWAEQDIQRLDTALRHIRETRTATLPRSSSAGQGVLDSQTTDEVPPASSNGGYLHREHQAYSALLSSA